MSDTKTAASGKMTFAVRAALMGAAALMAAGCATPYGSANENGGGSATGRYQFGYVVSSPSDIQAQVFSGESHTYVSLPSGVQLQAATGGGGLQSPMRKGPYWVVNGLATQWSFATTKGVVNATATGAARQMALVSGAQTAIAQTMPAVAPAPAVPVGTKNTAVNTSLAQVVGVKSAHTSITVSPEKHVASVPDKWLHTALPAPHHSEVFFIPGADGRIMPLQQALIHVIPAGWQTHISKYISPSIPVTWHKGLWTTSLNRMSKSDAWVDHVNFEKRTVRIDPTPALLIGIPGLSQKKTSSTPPVVAFASNPVVAATTSDQTAGVKAWASLEKLGKTASHTSPQTPISMASAAILKIPGVAPASTAQSTMPLAPVLPIKPVVIFTTHHGDMLSRDLREYLKKKGLHLAWNLSRNWRITYGYDLTGSLADVMNHLMHLYPIDIVGEGVNHTIVVTPAR
jgi:hypothetical protein